MPGNPAYEGDGLHIGPEPVRVPSPADGLVEHFVIVAGPDGAQCRVVSGREELRRALAASIFGDGPIDPQHREEETERWDRLLEDETADEHGFPKIYHESFEDGHVVVFRVTDPAAQLTEREADKRRIAELEEGLRPFADIASNLQSTFPDKDVPGRWATPYAGDLRRARSLLNGTSDAEGAES